MDKLIYGETTLLKFTMIVAISLRVRIVQILTVIPNVPKFSDRQVWVNSADPDQTAPSGEVAPRGAV